MLIFFKTENLNHYLKKFLIRNNIEIKNFNILNKNSTSKVLKKDYKNLPKKFFQNFEFIIV